MSQTLGFFKKSANAGVPYFHIFDGSICQKSKTELDGWEGPITTQHPTTKKEVHSWVMRYDSIAAFIIDSAWVKKEFTKEQGGGKTSGLELTLLAGEMRGILTLKWGQNGPDPVLKRFLKVAPNIDFEKPLLISAFKNKEGKQAVSFRQGDDPDPKNWVKVEEYWKRPVDPVTGQYDKNDAAIGEDGSVLPEPEHDDFQDTWSYAKQNNFLIKYYMETIHPRVKEISTRYAPTKPPVEAEAAMPTHTGPAVPPVGSVTERPANSAAEGFQDLATGEQRAQIKALSTQANLDFVGRCQEFLGCTFDELSQTGASFAIFKLNEIIAKQGAPAPAPQTLPTEAVAPPAPTPAPAPAVAAGSDWGAATAPAPTSAPISNEAPDFS